MHWNTLRGHQGHRRWVSKVSTYGNPVYIRKAITHVMVCFSFQSADIECWIYKHQEEGARLSLQESGVNGRGIADQRHNGRDSVGEFGRAADYVPESERDKPRVQ